MSRIVYRLLVKIGESRRHHFTTQGECAEFLGVKNASKKSLLSRAKKLGWEIEFKD